MFGDIKIEQVICPVKLAYDLVLMTKEETVLQGTTDRLIETEKCCGMEINVDKK
jgi:hypothetical protein